MGWMRDVYSLQLNHKNVYVYTNIYIYIVFSWNIFLLSIYLFVYLHFFLEHRHFLTILSWQGVRQKVQPHLALRGGSKLWIVCHSRDEAFHLFLLGTSRGTPTNGPKVKMIFGGSWLGQRWDISTVIPGSVKFVCLLIHKRKPYIKQAEFLYIFGNFPNVPSDFRFNSHKYVCIELERLEPFVFVAQR